MISQEERNDRLEKADELLRARGLRALVIIGSGGCGPKELGHYRYFVDNRVYYYLQALVAVPGEEPAVICGSPTHLQALQSRGFRDIRMRGDAIAEGIIDALRSKGVTEGAVGFCPEEVPIAWYDKILGALPGLTFEDVSKELYELRRSRGTEEIALARAGAALAVLGAERAREFAGPGVRMNDLYAEIEYAMKKNGAEETLTRLAAGAPGVSPAGDLRYAANDGRVLLPGELVYVEASPRCEGYWTQICRTVSLGDPSEETAKLYETALAVLRAGAECLVPGGELRTAALRMQRALEESGCAAGSAGGAVCGVDLSEEPVRADAAGTYREGMTVILQVNAAAGPGAAGVRWGDTYLVTEKGGELLTGNGRERVAAERAMVRP